MTTTARLWPRRTAVDDLTRADLLAVRAMLAAGAGPTDMLADLDVPGLLPVRAAVSAGTSLGELAGEHASGPADRPPAVASLVRALAMTEAVGAPAGPAVDGILDGLAAATRLRGLVRLRSAQALLSAQFLVALPVVAAVGLSLLDGDVRGFMTSPVGMVLMGVAAMLIAGAAWWIRRLVATVAAAGSRADPLASPSAGRPDPALVITLVVAVVAGMAAGPAGAAAAAAGTALLGGPVRRRIRTGGPQDPRSGGATPATERRLTFDRVDQPGAVPTAEAIDLLAVAISSGEGLAQACRLTAALAPPETRPAFHHVAAGLAAGLDPADAFPAQLAEMAGLIQVSHRWGAPVAQSLRMLTADLRDRAAVAAEEAAEQLTVRLVFPTTLLLVPAFGLLVVTPMMASLLGDVRLGP